MRRALKRSGMAMLLIAALMLGTPVASATSDKHGKDFVLEEATIAQVQAAFDDGSLTCVELVERYLDRIEAYEENGPELNAITTINPDALETAEELDAERERFGPRSRLHCIPVLLKDNIDTFDMPTSNGSVILKDAFAPDDAYVADNLRAQGALILGKASMGEFAGGPYSTLDGQMINPYNFKRNTGGSSAGSAAAVAANLTMLAVGTDTSTSVRGPSSYNGIVGLRPTTGLISRDGIAPKNLTFDTAGPMGRTVTDVALMMGALTGRDHSDPLNVEVYEEYPFDPEEGSPDNGIDYTGYLDDEALEGVRLGVLRDFFEGADPEIVELAEDALKVMEKQGATLVDISIDPEFLEFYVTNGGDNIREIADYRFYDEFQAYLETLGPDEDVPDSIEEMIEIYETEVNDSDLPVADSVLEDLLRDSLDDSIDEPEFQNLVNNLLPAAAEYKLSLFDDHDLDALVFPYEASFAAPISNPVETVEDPTYVPDTTPQAAIFAGYSDPGFPGIVVPMGFGSQGLPMDISFMGKPYSEGQLIAYAYDYEQASREREPSPLTPPLDD